MATQMNSRQRFLRMMGYCFTFALAFLFSTPASAAITHYGTFADVGGNGESAPDNLTLTNDAASTEAIVSVVINLSTAADAGAVFDVTGGGSWPFSAIAGTYDSAVVNGTNKTLTITFGGTVASEFNPGDVFSFTIDLDDSNPGGSVVQGASLVGAQVVATFATSGPVIALIADTGGDTADWSATAIPEPNTLALLGLGLTGLAWGGRRRR